MCAQVEGMVREITLLKTDLLTAQENNRQLKSELETKDKEVSVSPACEFIDEGSSSSK